MNRSDKFFWDADNMPIISKAEDLVTVSDARKIEIRTALEAGEIVIAKDAGEALFIREVENERLPPRRNE